MELCAAALPLKMAPGKARTAGPDGSSSREPLNNSLHAQSFRLVRPLGQGKEGRAFEGVCPSIGYLPSTRNNECEPAWKTRSTLACIKARPEAHICCALPPGKGTTLPVETRHNSCTLQATLSTQGVIQRLPRFATRPGDKMNAGAVAYRLQTGSSRRGHVADVQGVTGNGRSKPASATLWRASWRA